MQLKASEKLKTAPEGESFYTSQMFSMIGFFFDKLV